MVSDKDLGDLGHKIAGNTKAVSHSFGVTATDRGDLPSVTDNSPADPSNGPTGFWGRIGQVGIGRVKLLNLFHATKDVEEAGSDVVGATGRFLFKGTAKLANQGYQEGKQAVDTTKMILANKTHNPTAFANANKQSQKDYEGFKNSGGIFNVGTATNKEESQRGDLKSGVKKIGGATLEAAGELIPMAEVGKAYKVYNISKGVTKASEGIIEAITKNAVLGAISGAAGNAGGELLADGKISWKNVAKGGAAGAIIGGGSSAIGKLFGVFKGGAVKALDTLTNKGEKLSGDLPKSGMRDIISSEATDKAVSAATPKKIFPTGESVSEKVGVKTPLQPGIKQVSETNKIGVRTPQKMSPEDYTKKFNDLSKSYDKAYQALEGKPPATQKALGKAIDNRHVKALEQLNEDFKTGVMPDKTTVTKTASETLGAGKSTGGAPKEGVNVEGSTPSVPTKEAPNSNPVSTTSLKPVKSGGVSVPSQSAVKIKAKAIESGLGEDLGSVREHNVMDIPAQAKKAADLINTDSQKAVDIALGRAKAPSGTHPIAVMNAVKTMAIQNGDGDLLRQLAMSPVHDTATAAGQTFRILQEGNKDSPVAAIQQIMAERAKTAEKVLKEPVAVAVSKTAKEIETHVKPPTEFEWKSFVEGIKC